VGDFIDRAVIGWLHGSREGILGKEDDERERVL
jgi:hypothetical protein